MCPSAGIRFRIRQARLLPGLADDPAGLSSRMASLRVKVPLPRRWYDRHPVPQPPLRRAEHPGGRPAGQCDPAATRPVTRPPGRWRSGGRAAGPADRGRTADVTA